MPRGKENAERAPEESRTRAQVPEGEKIRSTERKEELHVVSHIDRWRAGAAHLSPAEGELSTEFAEPRRDDGLFVTTVGLERDEGAMRAADLVARRAADKLGEPLDYLANPNPANKELIPVNYKNWYETDGLTLPLLESPAETEAKMREAIAIAGKESLSSESDVSMGAVAFREGADEKSYEAVIGRLGKVDVYRLRGVELERLTHDDVSEVLRTDAKPRDTFLIVSGNVMESLDPDTLEEAASRNASDPEVMAKEITALARAKAEVTGRSPEMTIQAIRVNTTPKDRRATDLKELNNYLDTLRTSASSLGEFAGQLRSLAQINMERNASLTQALERADELGIENPALKAETAQLMKELRRIADMQTEVSDVLNPQREDEFGAVDTRAATPEYRPRPAKKENKTRGTAAGRPKLNKKNGAESSEEVAP